MKRAILGTLFCLAFLSAPGRANELAPDHAKEEPRKSSFGGTIGPVLKLSQFGNGMVTTIGGRVNATFFDIFIVGLGGHVAVAQNQLEIANKAEDISYSYGALGLGFQNQPAG